MTKSSRVSDIVVYLLSYSRKKPKTMGWGNTFLKKPLEFFGLLHNLWKFYRTFGNSTEKKLHPWNFCKWHRLEIITKLKTKAHGNSTYATWFFLEKPWKFHFSFNWSLEYPHALSSSPLEIPCPQPPCEFLSNSLSWFLKRSWSSPLHEREKQEYF